jgi:putative nucleotidyltransferase with HDIG domain
MYWAKSSGKDRVTVWDSALTSELTSAPSRYINGRKEPVTDVVAAFCAALAAKDPSTGEHTERCSWYTAALATELGLSNEDVTTARLASLLHDIGKLAVPDSILRKPGSLSAEERERMHRHSVDGANMLTQVQSLARSVPGILHHHEHYDGTGYPDGLAGHEIPIVARILLVSDAFDTMTTGRPYSEPISHEEAIEELLRHSGSQFDPDVVEAFVRVIARTGGFPARRAAERAVSVPQA